MISFIARDNHETLSKGATYLVGLVGLSRFGWLVGSLASDGFSASSTLLSIHFAETLAVVRLGCLFVNSSWKKIWPAINHDLFRCKTLVAIAAITMENHVTYHNITKLWFDKCIYICQSVRLSVRLTDHPSS